MTGNGFGEIFRFTSFGESHGKAIGCIVEGVPAQIPLEPSDIQTALNRRKPGQSKFTTQRKEPDAVQILSGVFNGLTTGTPIGLLIENEDSHSSDYSEIAQKFRPGHADFPYFLKYGNRDYRGGGRASAGMQFAPGTPLAGGAGCSTADSGDLRHLTDGFWQFGFPRYTGVLFFRV